MKTVRRIPPLIIEIRPSRMLLGEVGLFAAAKLRKGAIIATANTFDEVFVTMDIVRKANRVTQKQICDHCLTAPGGFWMPRQCDLNRVSVPWFMNHSCKPNVVVDRRDSFIAWHDIACGEELVFDYGTGHADPSWRMACCCGTPSCRGLITGSDWRSMELQTRYDGHFLSVLQKKIDGLRRGDL